MIHVYNIFLPFKGFKALTVWPFVFIRLEQKHNYTKIDDNHESIHGVQQLEFLVTIMALLVILSCVGFFSFGWVFTSPLWYFAFYGLEFVVRWAIYDFDSWVAYRNISFEQEAFIFQSDFNYLKTRKPFASFGYLFRTTYVKISK